MSEVMIDIETLGTKADSVVLSIGIYGNLNGKEFSVHKFLDAQEQIDKGRSITKSTLDFWMTQNDEARKIFSSKGESCRKALMEVSELLMPYSSNLKPYGNGASFDITIMENIFNTFNVPIPWKFWNVRCYRTIKSLSSVELIREGVHHTALDDAKTQYNHLVQILKEMK